MLEVLRETCRPVANVALHLGIRIAECHARWTCRKAVSKVQAQTQFVGAIQWADVHIDPERPADERHCPSVALVPPKTGDLLFDIVEVERRWHR